MINKLPDNWTAYELSLPYFKQGDDLRHCLENAPKRDYPPERDAFTAHAEMLEATASDLRIFANICYSSPMFVDADTHSILVSGNRDLLKTIHLDTCSFSEVEYEDCDEESGELAIKAV